MMRNSAVKNLFRIPRNGAPRGKRKRPNVVRFGGFEFWSSTNQPHLYAGAARILVLTLALVLGPWLLMPEAERLPPNTDACSCAAWVSIMDACQHHTVSHSGALTALYGAFSWSIALYLHAAGALALIQIYRGRTTTVGQRRRIRRLWSTSELSWLAVSLTHVAKDAFPHAYRPLQQELRRHRYWTKHRYWTILRYVRPLKDSIQTCCPRPFRCHQRFRRC